MEICKKCMDILIVIMYHLLMMAACYLPGSVAVCLWVPATGAVGREIWFSFPACGLHSGFEKNAGLDGPLAWFNTTVLCFPHMHSINLIDSTISHPINLLSPRLQTVSSISACEIMCLVLLAFRFSRWLAKCRSRALFGSQGWTSPGFVRTSSCFMSKFIFLLYYIYTKFIFVWIRSWRAAPEHHYHVKTLSARSYPAPG